MSNEEQDYQDVKIKNPLESLPKSTMKLDDCKRAYNDFKLTTKNFFTSKLPEMFDQNGYSLYKCEYKYDTDLNGRPDFVNNNFVRGLTQSLEDSRKYAFGVLYLEKNDNNNKLSGLWLLRGNTPIKEVFDEMVSDFTWSQLEFNNENLTNFDKVFYEDFHFKSMLI